MGTALGNQYALHALKERRALMTGEVNELERKLRHLRDSIKNLDATLALFSPDLDPTAIRPKRPRRKVKLFGAGKLNSMILDALRRGDRPMSLAEITAAVVASAGFGVGAETGMKPRVRSNLLYLTSVRGLVTKDGERVSAKWGLAE